MPSNYKYKSADKFIIFNEDPDLTTMKVLLPDPPSDPTEIIGYGLPPKDQKFHIQPIPKKLDEINRDTTKSISEKAKILRDDPEYYSEEVEYIAREWDRRLNGVWYYINGKPTYITGQFYFYLTAWFVDNPENKNKPSYRDRDRKFFVFVEHCELDPDCFGFIYPKHRREGATSKGCSMHYEKISRTKHAHGGIQSKTEDDAEMVFQDHIVNSWRKMSFWYTPIFEGSTNPKKVLSFNAPAIKVTNSNMGTGEVDSIESKIDYKASGKKAYDGKRLVFYHGDEIGKTELVDVYERHLVVRECLSKLDEIIGFAAYTSTAGEMTKGGGAAFKKMVKASDPAKRDGNGRTISGLYPLFIPAIEGFKMDEFGASLEKESLEFLENERKQALEDKDYDKLNTSTRQYPLRLRDCFRNAAAKDNFNMEIIQQQLDKFQFEDAPITVGDFEWENNVKDGRVIFTPKENGKFKVSYLFHNPKQSNRYIMHDGLRIPANDNKFMGGADTFKFDVTSSGKQSLGGGAIFMKRDYVTDPDEKPVEEWTSHRFVCTYLHRPPDKDTYCEDMLMMGIYYGCRICPEINVPAVWDHFKRRGYISYLHFASDKATGRINKKPGYNTQVKERESIFRAYQSFIEHHGKRLVHEDLLEQLLSIENDMGDYDLFTAGGLCLMATEDEDNYNYGDNDKRKEGTDISSLYRQREY